MHTERAAEFQKCCTPLTSSQESREERVVSGDLDRALADVDCEMLTRALRILVAERLDRNL